MTIDLSGVSPQVIGYFNAGMTAGRSAAQVAFKCLTSPLLLPINHGSFRPVDDRAAAGPSHQRDQAGRRALVDDDPDDRRRHVFKALAYACPERVIAGHHASLGGGGPYAYIDPATGNTYLPDGGAIGLAGGGWGATSDHDGMNATVCLNDGDTHNTPVEASEAKSPMVCIERALVPDSGGAGKFRGGLGVRVNIELLRAGHVPVADRTLTVSAMGSARRSGWIGESDRDQSPRRKRSDVRNRQGQPDTTGIRRSVHHRNGRRRRFLVTTRAASRSVCWRMCGRATCQSRRRNVTTESSSARPAPTGARSRSTMSERLPCARNSATSI